MVSTRLSLARRSSLQLQPATTSSSPTLQECCYKKKRNSIKVSGLSMATEAPAVPSPPVPSKESNGNTLLQLSTSTFAPMVPLGSTNDRPLLIPCDEEEEQRETKLKLNPLSRLKQPRKAHTGVNEYSPQMDEISKKMVIDVKSMLVSKLIYGTSNVNDMVTFANGAFSTLNWLGADYSCFYKAVEDLISHKYDLQVAERKGAMLTFSELEKKYEEVVISADDLEETIICTQAKLKTAKEKKEHVKRQIEKGEEVIHRLKEVVAHIEHDDEHLKHDEQKYKAAHKTAQVEVEKLGAQMEAARVMQKEIDECKNAALEGILSATRRLQCMD
ncbi:PREDICTED: uncharacterized protein LOC109242264 [Nicotiana attenuata]|nr:PREDICTED: uncharacterized protein LOC109242264 [Nicotiana attenuata]